LRLEREAYRDMHIVLTNDDGIDAPGLLAARQALEEIGDVLTVAPDRNRSGVGRSISFGLPLHVQEREMSDGVVGYACTGTPVDCVLGDDITYSGTVAGAMEGIVIGVPGIAVSLRIDRPWHQSTEEEGPLEPFSEELHFEPVAQFTARLAKIAFRGLPSGRILNLNAPNVPRERLKGARVTRLGRRFYRDELTEVRDEEGRIGYDIYNNPPGHHEEEGTDFAAIEDDEISVTPVHLELTDTAGLEELDSWDVGSLLERGLE
jgi:5'-nucleotidase